VCGDYAAHGRTYVDFDGAQSTIHSGDVGLYPGYTPATPINSNIYPNYVDGGGEIYTASQPFADATTTNHAAYLALPGTSMPVEMGGGIFTPGTYRSVGAINAVVNTFVTLDGNNEINPTFIFISTSAMTIGANVYFILNDGARFENILWVLGTAATVGANATVPGSVLAGTSITLGDNSRLEGCALAQEAVTFAGGGHASSGKY
jgi:hypothetical protein